MYICIHTYESVYIYRPQLLGQNVAQGAQIDIYIDR